MYVDAGWGSVKVAVARGTDLVFARIIQIGGRQFDEISAAAWGCTNSAARIRRIQEESAQAAPKPMRSAQAISEDESGSVLLRVGMAKADTQAEGHRSETVADAMLAEDRRIGVEPTTLTGVSTAYPQPDFI